MTETWIINQEPSFGNFTVDFTSNGQTFDSIKWVSDTSSSIMYFKSGENYTPAYAERLASSTVKQWYDANGSATTYSLTPWKRITLDEPATGSLLTWLRVNATKVYDFQRYLKARTVGTGDYVFRHYRKATQLAAPTNLSASGTNVVFTSVTNAEKYKVYLNGTYIGEATGTVVT